MRVGNHCARAPRWREGWPSSTWSIDGTGTGASNPFAGACWNSSFPGAMKQLLRSSLVRADEALAGAWLMMFRERPALLAFTFHALFRNAQEIERGDVKPQQAMTCEHFRRFIEYWLELGYTFVAPRDLLGGLNPQRKYVMLTFDDGYFNNFLAVSILAEFGVPAVFFISVNHVRDQKCYWWDVLYRERRRQGRSLEQIGREQIRMTRGGHNEIEQGIRDNFGPDALKPRGDIDRPMTVDELKEFARHAQVEIGNHTLDHAVLCNYTGTAVRQQIHGAQAAYQEMLGLRPISIGYPGGAFNQDVLDACREAGITIGLSGQLRKNYLPDALADDKAMALGRFLIYGNHRLRRQCESCRSDVQVFAAMQNWRRERRRSIESSSRAE
jgi:peptidoglycan/xylan/chitin deacetylase (PgdA/CDA1 family)